SGVAVNGCAITPEQAEGEQHILDLLNQHRAANGVPPLVLDQTLSLPAREHSCEMLYSQVLQHESVNGSTPFDRITAYGITFAQAGENIGDSDGESMLAGI